MINKIKKCWKLRCKARDLFRNSSGVAATEFALVLPFMVITLTGGVEMGHYVHVKTQVSQLALHAADHASRVGDGTVLDNIVISEGDINDVLEGTSLQGADLDLLNNGRIILSSLQTNKQGGQWIAWQRCYGNSAYTSNYGNTGDGKKGKKFGGMGQSGSLVKAPVGEAVMFAEIIYNYEPLFDMYGEMLDQKNISEIATFIVRDDRDVNSLVSPGTNAKTC